MIKGVTVGRLVILNKLSSWKVSYSIGPTYVALLDSLLPLIF